MADQPEVFESTEVTRLQLSPWVKAMPFAWLAFQLPRILPEDVLGPEITSMVTGGTLAGMIGILFLGVRRLNDRSAEPGAIRVNGEGVTWNGKLVAPRAKITNGVVMPGIHSKRTEVEARVRITRRLGGRIEFGTSSGAEARAMLRALGLDSSQVTATFRARSRMSGWLWWGALMCVMFALLPAFFAIGLGTMLAPLLPLLMLAMVVPMIVPTTAVIGTDGVLIKWFGTRRYVPYVSIARVEQEGTGVQFVLNDGSSARVEFGAGRGTTKAYREQAQIERDTFVTRVEQARTSAPTPDAQVDPSAVARVGRDATTWLDALRLLTQREGGMRTAPVLRDQLFGLVSDTRLDASTRAGAAAALGLEAGPSDRERLRVTAATIASPKLRVVVEAAANGDQAKLLEALDSVPEEAARAR